MLKKLVLTSVLVISMSTPLVFGKPVTPDTLALDSCVQIALEKNSDMLIAHENQKVAIAKTSNAWATIWPKISLQSQGGRASTTQQRVMFSSAGSPAGGFDIGSMMGEYLDSYSVKLAASQILFGAHVMPALEAANYGLLLADANYAVNRNSLIFKTKEAYIQILKADQMLRIAQENLKLNKQLIQQTEQMVAVGLAQKSDLLRLQLQDKNMEKMSALSENQTKSARYQLNMLLNRPVVSPLNLVDLGTDSSFFLTSPSANLLVHLAYQKRPELLVLSYQIKLYRTLSASIGSANWPVISLNGAYGLMNNQLAFSYERNKDWSFGINGQWKLVDGGEINSKVEENQAEINKLLEQENTLKNGIDLEISMVLNELALTRSQISAAEAEVALAQENQKIAKAKLSSGGITNLELIDSQNSLLKAQINLITAKYDYAIAKAKLCKSLGISENELIKLETEG